jgi:hypothetical protein
VITVCQLESKFRYVTEQKTKKEILDLINANYEHKISLTTLKRLFIKYGLYCKEKKQKRLENSLNIINKKYENRKLDEVVECKICGAKRISLVTHIVRIHKMTNDEYRRLYMTKTISKNESESLRKRNSVGMKTAWKEGRVKLNIFHFGHREINADEKILQKLSENLIYVGGVKKGYRLLLLKTSRYRNPDFVVINDEKYLEKLKGLKNWYEIQDKVTEDFRNNEIKIDKVVEFNGLYWHQQRFNGRTKEEYEKDMIKDYESGGYKCLVVWNDELQNTQTVKIKLNGFVQV